MLIYPRDFLVLRLNAMLLADSAETLTFSKRAEQKRKACRILRKLLTKPLGDPPTGVPLRDYFVVRNELYFHSGQWAKQAALGQKFLGKLPTASFGICVGNAWRAARYYCAGKTGLAKRYARKSLAHEKTAVKLYPHFYNLHMHLALAAGIVHGPAAAEIYLGRARAMSGRPKHYYEFEEIRSVLREKKLKDDY